MTITGNIIVLRHGQTFFNLEHRMSGQSDEVLLTKIGIRQAKAAGRLISAFRLSTVFSSPLRRALDTVKLALAAAGNQDHLLNADGTWNIQSRIEIIDKDVGDFQGRHYRTDGEFKKWELTRTFNMPMPHGDSDERLLARTAWLVEMELMPRILNGETILVAGHSSTVRALDVLLKGSDLSDGRSLWTARGGRVPNAAPRVYEFEDGVLKGVHALRRPPQFLRPEEGLSTPRDLQLGVLSA